MRTNTLVTLGASAVFGVMAIILARGWIEGAVEDEFRLPATVMSDIAAREAAHQAVTTIPVLVADNDLNFGDALTPESLRIVDMPEDMVPLEAFSEIADIFPTEYDALEADPLIILDTIYKNEVILPHRISGLNGRASLSARIRPGYRAFSIRVNDVTGVAGFIVPGDLVDIQYLSEPAPAGKIPVYRSDILLQSVRVLGIDQSHDQNRDQAQVARTVTLEVSHMDAQALAIAQEAGTLSLVLRAAGEALPSTTQSIDTRQLERRVNSHSAAKKPQKPIKVTPKPAARPVAKITVIRGESSQSVSVRKETLPSAPTTELAGG